MDVEHRSVEVGMGVVSSDGEELGEVKEVRENDFLLARPMQRDRWVPFTAIQAVVDSISNEEMVGPDHIVLTIPADKMDDMDWPTTPRS